MQIKEMEDRNDPQDKESDRLPSGQRQTSHLVAYPKNWRNLAGMSYLTFHIHPILHLQIITYFGQNYRIPLMERTLILWKPVKTTWSSLSPRKMSSFGGMES